MNIDNHLDVIKACRFCFMCRHLATLGNVTHRESDTPRGHALILDKVRMNEAALNNPHFIKTLYDAPLSGDWVYWDAFARNPSAAARDLWHIPAGNDTVLMADADDRLAVMKSDGGGYGLYLYNVPREGDWTFWDAYARNPSAVARDLWVIPYANDAVAMCGLDTAGDGLADSLAVVRNVSGDYSVYLWNLPAPGDWTYSDAVARNLVPRALDGWVITQRDDIEYVTGVNRGNSFDELGVMEDYWGDYNLYIWNAPRPGDLTEVQALARNPSALARDLWIVPADNDTSGMAGVKAQ